MIINVYVFAGIIAFLFGSILAFFVGSNSWHNPSRRSFALVTQLAAFWCLFPVVASLNHGEEINLFLVRLVYISGVLVPPFIVQFIFDVTENSRRKVRKLILIPVYLFSACFIFFVFHPQFIVSVNKHASLYVFQPGKIFHIFAAQYILICFISFFLLMHNLRSANLRNRTKLQYVAFALIIGIFSPLLHFSSSYFKWEPFPHDIFFIGYSSIVAYAIIRHELMDIQVVIKKTAAYLFWILFVSVPYVALVLGTHGLVSGSLNFSGHLNWFVISSFACALLTSGLAVFAFFYGKNSAQRLFVYFNIAVALWSAGCILAGLARNESAAIFGWRFSLLGAYFISPIFYHLTTEICETKRRRPILLFAYAQALALEMVILFKPELLLSGATPIFDFIAPMSTGLFALSIAIFYALVGLSFLVLLKKRKTASGQHQRQINYLICGFLLGFVASACNMPILLGLSFIYPIGNAGICVYALILAYAIFKHQLLDIRFVLKKAVFYTAIASFISFLYLGIIYLLHLTLFSGAETNSFFINFLSILIIAVVFKPVEIFFNRIVEKKFFSGTISQIAEAKERLETELERQERLRSVGILAAGMAHEIKNPLTAIKTFAEYLPMKGNDASFREKYSKIVNHEVARIQEIVTNLLLFSKPAEPKKQNVDVNELVAEIGQLLNAEMLKNSVHYEQRLAPSLKHVFVDRDQIKQVLLNIELNAIDAMKLKPGRLCVSTEDRGDFAIILIQDEGIGISQDKLPHIFDPFYSTKDHGTGLGLAVSYSILQKNKAKIEAESQEGTGTVFKIFLPALTIDSGERG